MGTICVDSTVHSPQESYSCPPTYEDSERRRTRYGITRTRDISSLAAVLVSAVLEPFLPRVSLPLVQMPLGIVIYFFVDSLPHSLSIDSGLFLVLFIAHRYLFDESKSANNKLLWTNRSTILGLAIGLVIVLVLCIGFTLNLLVPSVPLAAAFALGAAPGPTDSVAVASLSKDIKLNSRQKALLSGEALLNDASGVVSIPSSPSPRR